MDANTIMLSILFGAIGTGMFMYGRKQVDLRFVIAGVVLMIFPYFTPGVLSETIVGAIVTACPFFIH